MIVPLELAAIAADRCTGSAFEPTREYTSPIPTPRSIRVAEVAAVASIAAPLSGWVIVLLFGGSDGTAGVVAVWSFPVSGLVGIGGFLVAVAALLYARFVEGERQGAGRAIALTLLGPLSWLAAWLIALLAWMVYLSQPGASDGFFDVFGGAH